MMWPVIAEAGQRLEQIGASGDSAVAGFQSPDRHQYAGIDAGLRLKPSERVIIGSIIVTAAAD